MKKIVFAFLCVCLLVNFTACGTEQPASASAKPSASAPEAAPTPTANADTPAAPAESARLSENISLTDEEIEAARQAAMDYYAGTVFEVSSLTPLTPDTAPVWEGEIVFQTVCSKGGTAQPDRTISLERQDGIWTVINEGY